MGGRSAGTTPKYSIKFAFIAAVGHLLVDLGVHQLYHRRAIDASSSSRVHFQLQKHGKHRDASGVRGRHDAPVVFANGD